MAKALYQALGPLVSGEGSRASLGIEVAEGTLPRVVALFWLPEEVPRDSEAEAKIAREIERASSLAHPNIIKVLGLARLDEGLARVVELVDGEPLRRVLDVAGKLPPRLAALVTADAAMGAHHAHVAPSEDGTPLLHGDLRPETLWVSFSGVCKVGGYGAPSAAPKEQGARGGRLRAPEQIAASRNAIHRQTDVYLLGMVLFECLAGRVSLGDDPDRDRAVLNQTFPRLLAGGAPPELIRVVEQATAKSAQDRFPTARALRDAIDRAVGILPAHEELAVFLRGFFPEGSPARSARRREIESAIAELARQESERTQMVSRATQTAKSANPREAGLIEIPSAASPEPPKPPLAVLNPPKKRTIGTNALAVLLVLAALGYWYLHSMELPGATERRASVGSASASVAPAAVTDPHAGIESVVDPPVRIESAPAKAAEASAPAPSATKITAPPSPAAAALELRVEPPVEIAIDGRAVGRSPVSFMVTPGKHLLQFTDASRGIDVSRPIRVADGRKISQRMVIGKGIVEVSAPDGAAIYIDGKPVGTTPLGAISVYEGKHRILATLGGAKWQQGFVLGADERMSFKIETVEQ